MRTTLEKLSEKLNGKYWEKGGLKRVYLTRGHNTKKMSTKVYVEQINLEFVVKCFVECPSQDYNWCKSQADIVIKKVQQEIKEVLATEYFYVVNSKNEVINDCCEVEALEDLYVGGGLYLSREEAKEFIDLEDIEATVLSISKDDFIALEFLENDQNNEPTTTLYRADDYINNSGNCLGIFTLFRDAKAEIEFDNLVVEAQDGNFSQITQFTVLTSKFEKIDEFDQKQMFSLWEEGEIIRDYYFI
jgi:hypothetical protein